MSEMIREADQATNTELVASLARMLAVLDEKQLNCGSKPARFNKPRYGTQEYYHAYACGWIETEDAERDRAVYLARSARAKDSYAKRASRDPRLDRPEPASSRKYVRPMVTIAFRDD